MLINLGTGNVTVVLLMGGKSSLSAYNAFGALAVNVVLNLVLLPRIGIAGAAIAWAASIAVDNIASAIEVWVTLGIGSFGPGYWPMAFVTAACFGTVGLVVRGLMGATLLALVVASAVGVTVFVGALYATRARLGLMGLCEILRVRPSRAPSPSQENRQAA
jgi:O-antigen/teichoic acid export membrane protein